MHKKMLSALLLMLAIGLAACGATLAPAQPVETTTADAPETEAIAPATTTAPSEETGPASTETSSTEANLRTFTIASDRSQVQFTIDEVLRGSPNTVTGVNNQVVGEVQVDPANPANTQIGPIQIDAAGFVTDEDRRNNAIRRFILQTSRYPQIVFSPTGVSGLPESANVGDRFDFQVTGDLTVLDRTNSVTFDLTADVVSDNEIQVSGTATIQRSDFGLSIPSIPFVASVDEALGLEADLIILANQ